LSAVDNQVTQDIAGYPSAKIMAGSGFSEKVDVCKHNLEANHQAQRNTADSDNLAGLAALQWGSWLQRTMLNLPVGQNKIDTLVMNITLTQVYKQL
jgi:hypothetical protein